MRRMTKKTRGQRMNSASQPSWFKLFLVVALMISPAIAHEQKAALTDIFYNERTGNLEIAHRISVHDAEHALHKTTDSKADVSSSAKAQEAFSKYAAERFALYVDKNENLELERGYFWVYQETRIPSPSGTSFYIQNSILHDTVKGQVNTVNVRFRDKVSTFKFEADSGAKLYSRGKDQEVLKSE